MEYTLWLFNVAMENHHFSKVNHHMTSINGPFSMAMLNNQRVNGMLICLVVWNMNFIFPYIGNNTPN